MAIAPTVRVDVDTSRLNEILRRLPGNLDDAVRATAFAVEAHAKTNAPVDTGALRSSIYTVTSKSDGYSEASGDVVGKRADSPMVRLPQPKPGEAHVGPAVEYGFYVEMGTRRMAARPYLTQAVQTVAHGLIDQWGDVIDG